MRSPALLAASVLTVLAAAGWWFFGRDPGAQAVAPLDDGGTVANETGDGTGPDLRGGRRPTPLGVGSSEQVVSPYRISGLVVDETGHPVGGVPVRANRSGGAKDPADTASWGDAKANDGVRKTFAELDDPTIAERANAPASVSDRAGRFDVSVAAAGAYDLRALPISDRVGGWAYARLTRDKPVVGHVTIKLVPGAPLAGRVVDATGKGVVAFVSGLWTIVRADGSPSQTMIPQAETDSAGEFTLAAVPEGKGELTVRVAGRGAFSGFKVVTPAKERIVLRVGAATVVRGHVVDMKGEAVAAADVSVSTSASGLVANGSPRHAMIRGKTGSDGTYRIEGLVPGTVRSVVVAAAGYVSISQSIPSATWTGTETKEGVETTIDLVLFRGGAVMGRVFDENGKDASTPVTNAEVFLLAEQARAGDQPPPRVATVDKNGGFRFDGAALGKYVLYARSATHYLAADIGGRSALPDATTVLVLTTDGETFEKNLFMRKGLPVTGIVTGPDGRPVEGATIHSNTTDFLSDDSWRYGLHAEGAMVLATSGADGRFQILGLAPGDRMTLTARKRPLAGKSSEPFDVRADAPAPDVTLELERGGSIAGRVVDADGKGVSGAIVSSWHAGGNRGDTDTTRADGTFKHEGLSAGTYQLSCWVDSGGNARKRLEPELKSGEDREGVELKLRASGKASTLSGVVVDEAGDPVAECQLNAHGKQGSIAWASTDADGSFTLRGLEAGRVTISARGRSGEELSTGDATATYEVPGEGIQVVVTKKPTILVAGRILLPDGTPCPLCNLATRPGTGARGTVAPTPVRTSGGVIAMTYGSTSDGEEIANGTFRREVSLAAPFDLVVTAPRDAHGRALNLRWKATTISAPNSFLEIRLEYGQVVRGRVLGSDGSPVAGANVTTADGLSSDRTDADGSFRLEGLEGDEISITVEPGGRYVAPEEPTRAKPGATDVVVRLEAALAIAGRVVDATGGVIALAYVTVMGTAEADRTSHSADVERGGTFRVEGLPKDGIYDVSVRVRSVGAAGVRYKPWSKPGVRAGTENLLVQLEGGESLEGVVVDADGKPVPNASVIANPVGGGTGTQLASTDEQGRFTLSGLEPGVQVVYAQQRAGTKRQTLPVRVVAGARNVRLVFLATVTLNGRLTGDGDKQGFSVAVRLRGPLAPDGGPPVASGRTTADGTFSLEVPIGTLLDVAVMSRIDDRWGLASGVRGGGAEVVVRVEVGQTIEGTLEDADGNPVTQGAWISATSESWTSNGSIDAAGRFKIRALAPGRYTLRARSGAGGTNTATIDADAGATGVRLRRTGR